MTGNSSDYPPGFQINKAYEVIGIIGHGGMGAVYRVRHLFLSKEMALKVLPTEQVSEVSWRRFQIEAQAIARLTHPNIVRIFDMGMVDGVTPYYAMELLNGHSLAQTLKKKHVLPVKEAIGIFRQVCAGLAYAHEHEIIHRDIKPANVVLQEVEPGVISAKLVDFGIAKLTGLGDGDKQGLTRPGEVFGSPQYMSPEQCAGLPVDFRTDLYSLGASLFESLTGKVPFRGSDAMATVHMHQNDEPPSLEEASEGADFPPAIQELVNALLAKDPEDRPQSASEVAAELLVIERSLANEESNEMRSQSATGVRKPFSKRSSEDSDEDSNSQETTKKNSLIVVAVASVLAIALLGGIAYFVVTQKLASQSVAEATKKDKNEEISAQLKIEEAFKSEAESKEPFFLGTTNKDGHQVSHFKFPEELSLGSLTLRTDDEVKEQDAKGELFIPTRYSLQFTPNNLCLKNPHILRRFDENTNLQAITLTTDGDDFSNSISASAPQAKEHQVVSKDGKRLHRSDIVNNETLKNLTQVKSLKTIELNESSVTGEVLVTLARFPKLMDLKIGGTDIDGEQLAQSGILPSLQILHADSCSKISAAIAALENSPKLRKLFVSFCNIGAKDIQNISTMKQLTRLKLSNNALKDSDLEPLTKLPKLDNLELDDCKITPASVKILSRCKALTNLGVRRNLWTSEQFQAFKNEINKANPQLKIEEDLGNDPSLNQLAAPPQNDD